MNTYLVKWPDGSASLVQANEEVELFIKLDTEGDPNCATIYKVAGSGNFHFTFNIAKQNKEQFIDVDLGGESSKIKLQKFKFRKDIIIRCLARITRSKVKFWKQTPQNKIQEIKDGLGWE